MANSNFDTTTRRRDTDPQKSLADFFRHHLPQIVVSALVVAVLAGGALYASRASETAPHVVYSVSLNQIQQDVQQPLLVNINTADAEELDELPQVGPSTAETIIQYREANGLFRSVSELEEVPGIGPATLEEIKPFATI
ncbi:MAG: helix-hairpin-helix domain-containing protein [Rubrobacter sp.]|nr:helix-hairpin-helix domain-containing protein [Rubrobacter sp.]